MPQSLDDIMSAKDASASEATHQPEFSDADRAANPLGVARAERQRDEQGRFAVKDQERPEAEQQPDAEATQAQPEQGQRKPGTVPQPALAAARGKARDAETRYAELEASIPGRIQQAVQEAMRGMQMPPQAAPKPPEPQAAPEIWTDPNKWAEYQMRQAVDPVQQRMQQMTLGWSKRFAEQAHGAEAVSEAVQALGAVRVQNPGEFARLEAMAANSEDPVGDVVRWHKNQRAQAEIGGDLDAWRTRERERLRQEIIAEQGGVPVQQQPAAQGQPRFPSSFAAPSAGGPRSNGYGGPKPLSEIMPRG